MSIAKAARDVSVDDQRIREVWLARLAEFLDSVEGWVKEAGWATRRIEKRMEDIGPTELKEKAYRATLVSASLLAAGLTLLWPISAATIRPPK